MSTSFYAKSLTYEWFSTSTEIKHRARVGSSRKFKKPSGKKPNVCRAAHFLQHRGTNGWQGAGGSSRLADHRLADPSPRRRRLWPVRHRDRLSRAVCGLCRLRALYVRGAGNFSPYGGSPAGRQTFQKLSNFE